MRRFAQVLVVLMLALGVSGVTGLVVAEPCTAVESTGDDGNCPPTCVTCGCCHYAIDVASHRPVLVSPTPPREATDVLRSLSDTAPRDILHVPRL